MTEKQEEIFDKRSGGLWLNLFLLRLSRNWLRVALVLAGIYVTLPFAAPTLMHLGYTRAARAIYIMYSPFCHQFAFRSFFLFGEQPFYPRASTGTTVTPYETYVLAAPESSFPRTANPYVFSPGLQLDARAFYGNERMGYKVTICERDISIYMMIFFGGMVFALVRRRLRPAPLWLYVILGLGPIGLDGFSQLLGYPPFNLWPARETLPVFRVVTGLLFGFMNVWLGFPYLEASFNDTRRAIEAKLWRAGIDPQTV